MLVFKNVAIPLKQGLIFNKKSNLKMAIPLRRNPFEAGTNFQYNKANNAISNLRSQSL